MTNKTPAKDKVAVVTGGGQGIGYAISEALRKSGVHVVIADLNETTGKQAADELGASFIKLDVTDRPAIREAADVVVREHGRVDILINNAGAAHEDPALEVNDATWDRIIDINLTSAFTTSREFGRYFIEQGSGSIVSLSSIAAFIGISPEFHVAYDVAKAGISQMTRSLAVEWAPHGVRVNAIAPGRTRTPLVEALATENPSRVQEWIDQVPQKRLLDPQEIASVVTFLALESASAVTGHTLLADGGQVIS